MVENRKFFRIELPGVTYDDPARLDDMLSFVEFLRPKPSPFPLFRAGRSGDGSYLVPADLDGVTDCFSPGVNNFKDFEDYLVKTYGIKCHMCDYSSDVDRLAAPLIAGMQTFEKKWLDVNDEGDNISLKSWVPRSAPAGDLMLQIDIEGAEYRNFLACPDDVLSRFRIIVVELHGLTQITSRLVFDNVFGPLQAKLGRYFTSVHAHPNNSGRDVLIPGSNVRIPRLIELTLLRNDRFDSSRPLHPVVLPHPLDLARNVRSKPPLFLEDGWYVGERPIEGRLKMLEDKVAYLDYVAVVDAPEAPPKRKAKSTTNRTLSHRIKRRLRRIADTLSLTR